MKAGRLRHQIDLSRMDIALDTMGAPVKSWAKVATVAAEIRYLRGTEKHSAAQELAEATGYIYIREIPGLTVDPSMRAQDTDTGAVFDILSVIPSHTRALLTLMVKQGSKSP